MAKILADPAIKAKADASGLFPATSTPAEFAAFIRKEAERWSTVVKETGMQIRLSAEDHADARIPQDRARARLSA